MPILLRAFLLTLLSVSFCLKASAESGPVSVSVDVPSQQWKGIRLKNLSQNAVVAVQIESSGDIMVTLVDAKTYLQSSGSRRPLFQGHVERRLSFSVSIQKPGDQYLVFDNRRGKDTRSLTVTVQAARGGENQMEAANKILLEFERYLHRIFVFDPFPIGVRQCGSPRGFDNESGIILCAEYIYHLYDTIVDQERTKDALSFSIFHKTGQVLLSKWNHPFASNTDVQDEFATVLLVMNNQEKRVSDIAEYFLENPSKVALLRKLFQDECRILTKKRARNVLQWLKDPQLVRNWQKTLGPHMQTSLLEKLRLNPTPWTDIDLVEKELSERKNSSRLAI